MGVSPLKAWGNTLIRSLAYSFQFPPRPQYFWQPRAINDVWGGPLRGYPNQNVINKCLEMKQVSALCA